MSKDILTKKDIAKDLVDALRLLKHVDEQLGRLSNLPESTQALINGLRLKIIEYLKGRGI